MIDQVFIYILLYLYPPLSFTYLHRQLYICILDVYCPFSLFHWYTVYCVLWKAGDGKLVSHINIHDGTYHVCNEQMMLKITKSTLNCFNENKAELYLTFNGGSGNSLDPLLTFSRQACSLLSKRVSPVAVYMVGFGLLSFWKWEWRDWI